VGIHKIKKTGGRVLKKTTPRMNARMLHGKIRGRAKGGGNEEKKDPTS